MIAIAVATSEVYNIKLIVANEENETHFYSLLRTSTIVDNMTLGEVFSELADLFGMSTIVVFLHFNTK